MRRLLPLLALLSLATACRSPDSTTVQDAPTPPATQTRQVVELPKLEDLDPELRKKTEALIAQLGAESFKDRRKAREALMAMEPAIIPLLENHLADAEPEVRNALPLVIKSLSAKLSVTIPDLKLKLVAIRPGSFMMGSINCGSDEKPVHKVTLTKGFWMGRTEVTQSQYKGIMGKNPSHFKGANNPVEMVSWNDAVKFCKKLTAHERHGRRLPANQEYRLPTEAEWEYCCRAGSDTEFHYGNSLSSTQANFEGDYPYGGASKGIDRKETISVGSFKPNAWGLYDMHGNVWEWCYDWYGKSTYGNDPRTDPTGMQSGLNRVFRGGGWGDVASSCRSARRVSGRPTERADGIGFRIVRAQVDKTKHP